MKTLWMTAMLTVLSGAPALAQGPLPPNTIDCNQFKKNTDTEWAQTGSSDFDVGLSRGNNLAGRPITPGGIALGTSDAFDVIDRLCSH